MQLFLAMLACVRALRSVPGLRGGLASSLKASTRPAAPLRSLAASEIQREGWGALTTGSAAAPHTHYSRLMAEDAQEEYADPNVAMALHTRPARTLRAYACMRPQIKCRLLLAAYGVGPVQTIRSAKSCDDHHE